MGALKNWFMKVTLCWIYIFDTIFDAQILPFKGSKNAHIWDFSVGQAELEAASSNSIALSLQQMNDIRQTLVNTLVKSLFQRVWFTAFTGRNLGRSKNAARGLTRAISLGRKAALQP